MATSSSRGEVIRLYRRILKLAQQYPSVKRDGIIQDIKLEFHENKHLTEPRAIQEKVASARAGLRELAVYAGLNQSSMTWTVDVGRDAGANAVPAAAASPSVKVVGENKQ
ncbi:hypothetical protein P43SY_005845 [Pythium insidiosum]|uniref:Complex 1 LYR protein domain-containing protein n=1 Tax=Pythium insidiosum TaxID=114742 RepID=A0AAD5MCD8_PYTIN|nr:hypothetical protein P43SY_005845 [Pythium insidiosum]KAJ0412607.1 hypothetical protein ATCC90586_006974 [Pythium insidiosum]